MMMNDENDVADRRDDAENAEVRERQEALTRNLGRIALIAAGVRIAD
jgi:transcription elongation GreA/GreB family factor